MGRHRSAMRYLVALVASLGLAVAADEKNQIPAVDAVISARVKSLPEPAPIPVPKGITMAITATDPKAQKHVLDGIANLHGGWDFEAYRHFVAALQLDPECLMAHWGVVVALIDPEPDLIPVRTAALKRLVELVEQEAGTELERDYAYAIGVFFNNGPAACSDAFRKISEKFPNDPQLKLMQAAFGRGGYDDSGSPTPDQERAETILDEMLAKDPDHPLFLNAFLTIRAEAPDLRGDLARARRLCEVAPGYAPFLHLLGHYELRNGNIAQAIEAFTQAGEIYSQWMKSSGVSHSDCPGWVKAECYRAAALANKGDYNSALAVAKTVAAIKVPPEEARREGAQLLLWEGRTLATRLLMRRSQPGDTALAIAALPKPEDQKVYEKDKRTHCAWFYQGLAFLLESRKKLEEGKLQEAQEIASAVTLHGEKMAENRDAAAAAGERSAWIRAFKALEISASELRGAMAMAGPKDGIGSAFNWYRAALDRQTPPSMLMPPTVLLPMEARLGEYYLAKGDAKAAVDILVEAQGKHTNDIEILTRLQKALTKAGHADQAKAIAEEIEKVKTE
jgi:tetratricopeptide (TPR) repeat protein